MNIQNKREFQQIALNYSSNIGSKDFIKIYKKCTSKPYSLLVVDTTLPSIKNYNMILTEKVQ